jgi:hypothetical protein
MGYINANAKGLQVCKGRLKPIPHEARRDRPISIVDDGS